MCHFNQNENYTPISTFRLYILPHDSNEHPKTAIQLDMEIMPKGFSDKFLRGLQNDEFSFWSSWPQVLAQLPKMIDI